MSNIVDFKLAIPETDMRRIVKWEDVDSGEQYEIYFKQRLGPDFAKTPAILISRDAFRRLLRGPDALFAEMYEADIEAVRDIYFAFAAGKDHGVIMGLSIEHPQVGQKALRFIEENKRSEEHEEWLKKLREVATRSRQLHLQWQQQAVVNGFQYHSINIPKPRSADSDADVDVAV